MNQRKSDKIAQDIIQANQYMTLATATKSGKSWAAPVYYCIDTSYRFYFISQLRSVHIKHILANNTVAFAIFDSHQKEGTGNGVQGSGKVVLLEDRQLGNALQWYHTSFIPMNKESFRGNALYRMFMLVPRKVYILDSDAKVDTRIAVNLTANN